MLGSKEHKGDMLQSARLHTLPSLMPVVQFFPSSSSNGSGTLFPSWANFCSFSYLNMEWLSVSANVAQA